MSDESYRWKERPPLPSTRWERAAWGGLVFFAALPALIELAHLIQEAV